MPKYINDLDGCHRMAQRTLLILYIPICLMVLFCAVYSTYLTVNTWDCDSVSIRNSSIKQSVSKCNTIIDVLSKTILKMFPHRKIVVMSRTASFYNTLITYLSAIYSTYNLSLFPLLWLAFISILSFLITFYVCLSYGPVTGINNLELIPIVLGLNIEPYLVLPIVLIVDLVISVLALYLVLDINRKRQLIIN